MEENLVKEESKEENLETEKIKEKAKHVKEKTDKKQPKKGKKKILVISIIISALIILGLIVSTIFALLNINNEKIINGVSISEIDLSGLSKEEAKTKIENLYNEKKQKEINLKYEEYETTLKPEVLEVEYNIEKAIDDAYLVGRSDNIIVNNYEILFTLIGKKNIDIEMTLNEEKTKESIEEIGLKLPGAVAESSYSVEEDELIITKGKSGIKIDTENLLQKLKENLVKINSKEEIIEIPTYQKEPEEINIDKIHEEVYQEAKDAYYTKEPFEVHPEVEGIDFNVEEAKALLSEDKEEYVIKLIITKPKVTIDQIGSEAFPDRLSVFTTRFDESDVDRSTNLRIACQKINGKVLLAGETFSYNKTLGARTAAAGYRNGKIYAGGEVVDGIGGGICQISSTLYNAALMANLQIVERRNHQFVTSYVGPGRDATVVYGVTDFKFKNTRKYPVRITASARNGIATVTFYGIKEENEYTFDFQTTTIASIAPTTTYEEDPSMPAGTEKVKRKGTNGVKTQTYITKLQNGKVISRALLSTDTYDAMSRVIIKGTGGSSTVVPQPTPATPTENKTSTQEATDTQSNDNQEPIQPTNTEPEATIPTEGNSGEGE